MAMIMKTFYLPESLYSDLAHSAKRRKISISELVRRKLKRSVKKEENPYLDGTKFLGELLKIKAIGAPKDLAKNHDKYIWE